MRKTLVTLALLAAVPVAAQQPQSQEKDPTVKVKSTGLPAGWTVRLDDKERRYTVDDTRFVSMGSGYHVTSGPAAVYYSKNDVFTGPSTIGGSFRQTKAPMHPEAYGLFIGGSKLDTPEQQYMYFLVRGDGKYFVAHRAGSEVHKIVDWTESAAVKKQDDAGVATNALAIQTTKDSVLLSVNGQRVQSFAKSALHGFVTDGQAGIRVNHNLDVHVADFGIRK
ncbi:MAG TPA: hypothetical protein VKH19_18885 [Gemmatimonadaceae bacterium]|nr:hypothetical protein [Gemmatimonadaceae bacterium]